MKSRIKITSTGTGNHDGLASQLLCKLNAVMYASYFGYQYVDIPFDDFLIAGNGGHRYGYYSTALQNLIFTFPGFEKVDPLSSVYERLKVIDFNEVLGKVNGFVETSNYINSQIDLFSKDFDVFVLNGFSSLFSDKTYLYNKISGGMNFVIDPTFLNKRFALSEKFKICVHIRRGDITAHEVNYHRIIPVQYFNEVVKSVKEILLDKGVDFFINLHIEGDSEEFSHEHIKFQELNPMASFFDFLSADLIVSSKSSHSTVPAMLSGKMMIYPNDSWLTTLPEWISADKDGVFDKSKFSALIKNYC